MSEVKPHQRINDILLGPIERPALAWMAAHMPGWMTPDILTGTGIVGAIVIFLSYWGSGMAPGFLWAASLGFVINWFGDSLDGTLARQRNRERPRYGYYVDHITDSFGTSLLLLGLGLSNYMSGAVAAAVLIAYLLLSINSYLAAHTLGTFRISFLKFSPTELRLLLAFGNLFLFNKSQVVFLGVTARIYDIGGVIGTVLMLVVVVACSVRNTHRLYVLEHPGE